MSKFFNKLIVDTQNAKIVKEVGECTDKNGYHILYTKDCFGNKYRYRHEVIMAEGLGLPKHLWPVDKFGRRYIVDHIIPVSNGGTDSFENLRLIPFAYNAKNENSKKNYEKSNSAKAKPIGAFDKEGKLIKVYNTSKEVIEDGFNPSSVRKKISQQKRLKGVLFKRL